ncbi:MAG TPA: methyltransferase [Chloroflexota bacterium]|nr:methyltransferase [Chloroflexota bacterium]
MTRGLTERCARRFWRTIRWQRFVLVQQPRHDRFVVERIGSRRFVVLPGVFNPALFGSSALLASVVEALPLNADTSVLDLGTGSGVGAIVAGSRAASVIGVDLNPEAIRCARINVQLHHLEQSVELRTGDLFEPVAGRQFDYVLFNPPYFSGRPGSLLDLAFHSLDVPERFAADLPRHLAPGGEAVLVLSEEADVERFLGPLREKGYVLSVMSESRSLGERFRAYRVARASGDGEVSDDRSLQSAE